MARHDRNPALSVDAVWIRGGTVLLVRRGRPPFKGRWAFPGGFVGYYETVEEAIQREVREETGLEIRPLGLVGVYSGPDRDPRHPTTSVVFFVTGAPRLPKGGDDAAEARWVPLKDARRLAFDHDRILADARRLKARAPRRPARP